MLVPALTTAPEPESEMVQTGAWAATPRLTKDCRDGPIWQVHSQAGEIVNINTEIMKEQQ